MKTALVTPFIGHLPLHPGSYLGYGAAVLTKTYEIDILDLNAHIYFENKHRLRKTLLEIETREVVFDYIHFSLLISELSDCVEQTYASIPWEKYRSVFITTPTWFVTIPTQAVLKLADHIKKQAPHVKLFFFGNSLGSWTNKRELKRSGITILHLNDLFQLDAVNQPVAYDCLPTPVYGNRKKYIFDILPFRLKHGCIWGKCRFCSLTRGWNSGYLERSATKVFEEIGELIHIHKPEMLVCRDNSINGQNLLEFCAGFEKFEKPWIGMARADLSAKEIEALQKAGCRLIYFGLESGSDRVLNEMNKGIGSGQMSDFIKAMHDHDIAPAPSVVVGSPGETDEDFEKTIQFILDHENYLDTLNLYPFMATPASYFSLMKKEPDTHTSIRLNKLIRVCEDLGIKVCIGEQSAELVLFKKVYTGDANF